jgi:hypothetical protein
MAGLLALSLGGLALALDDPKPGGSPQQSRAERLQALLQAWPLAEFHKALDSAKTTEEKQAVSREYGRRLSASRTKAIELALALVQEDPKDDVGLEALKVLLTVSDVRSGDKARALVIQHHLTNPNIESVVPTVARKGHGYDVTVLKTLVEKNPSKPVKATAAYLLAQNIKAGAGGPKVKDVEIEAKQGEAIQAFEKVVAEYGDMQVAGLRGKIADLAGTAIQEIKRSQVGKVAPEIETEDIDGVRFKLLDYRGKVVLLDFWGHW